MFPADALKKVGDSIEMKIINVITPLSADIAPTGNVLDYLHVKVNGRELSQEEMKEVGVSANGVSTTMAEFQKLGVVAVGTEVIFSFTSEETKNAQPGDSFTVEVIIPAVGAIIHLERNLV